MLGNSVYNVLLYAHIQLCIFVSQYDNINIFMYLSVTYEVTTPYNVDLQSIFVCLLYCLFPEYIINYYLVGMFDFVGFELLQIPFRGGY